MWNEFRNRIAGLLCLGVGLGLGCPALAGGDDRLQLHGFLTQTLVHTDANNFGGESEDGVGVDMRELGVNISFRPDSDWLLSAQGLARWAGEMDDGDPRVDYAFVERSLYADEAHRLSVSLGNVKNPYGLYNTTRDVAHTRPGVILPQAIYLDRMRNFFLAAPGMSLRGEHEGMRHGLNWQLSTVRMEADDPELDYLFMPIPGSTVNAPGHFDGSGSWLAQTMLDLDGGQWRLGLSFGDVGMRYKPALPQPFDYPSGKVTLKPVTLTLQRNLEKVTFTAEFSRAKVDNESLAINFVSQGWYAQATWRFRPRWEAWLRNEAIYFDKDNKNGSRYDSLLLERGLGHSKSWVLGVRHDLTAQLALSAELHSVNGLAMLSPADNPDPVNDRFSSNWNMLLLQAAYRF
ncbi:MAG: hypothetical protein AB1421_13235 [Pseudomonadota bacterium]